MELKAERAPEPIVLTEAAMVAPEFADHAFGISAYFSTPRPNAESSNQDAAAVIPLGPGSGVLAVADGMGGARAGEQASQLAISSLLAKVSEVQNPSQDLRAAILDGFEHANREILKLGVGAGTTLAVVEIGEEYIRPYHVGDSSLLAVGNRGTIKFQNIAHSPTGYAVESGMLDESDALHHIDRHVISNFVGSQDMHIEVGPVFTLARRDTILLASDGLSDNLRTEEIVERIRKGPLLNAANALIEVARERMQGETAESTLSKPDDLTFIAFRRNGDK